jgi:acyl dehydratase
VSELPDFLTPGYRADLGTHVFTAEEIVRFAEKYDPQLFHVDVEAARASIFGGLCASGWHTAAVWMRKQRDHAARRAKLRAEAGLPAVEFGPSPGFENLKWLRPVYAGEEIRFYCETTVFRPSASRPGWHVFTGNNGGTLLDGTPVISFTSSALVRYPAA